MSAQRVGAHSKRAVGVQRARSGRTAGRVVGAQRARSGRAAGVRGGARCSGSGGTVGAEPATSEVFKAAKAPAAKALVRFDVNEKQASDVEQSANATAKVIAKTSRESYYYWEDANNPQSEAWSMHFKNVSRDEAFTQLCRRAVSKTLIASGELRRERC